MTLKEQLKSDLKDAMRAKDIVKRDSVRAINTMIKQIEVDERKDLNDDDIITLIQKGIKQRNDAIIQYQKASRNDLVLIEQEQINIFSLYLPTQLDDNELQNIIANIIKNINASSIKDMGKVMSQSKKEIGAKADGKRINLFVKKLLG